jgi:hypothetical protein
MSRLTLKQVFSPESVAEIIYTRDLLIVLETTSGLLQWNYPLRGFRVLGASIVTTLLVPFMVWALVVFTIMAAFGRSVYGRILLVFLS